jgi:hypothetical protein
MDGILDIWHCDGVEIGLEYLGIWMGIGNGTLDWFR